MTSDLPLFRPLSTIFLFICDSILLFACYVLVAYQVPQIDGEFYLFYDNGLMQIGLLVLVIQVALSTRLLYRNITFSSRVLLFLKVCWALGIAFLYQSLGSYVLPSLGLPRSVMFYGSLLSLAALPAWRSAFAAFARKTIVPKRILFIGASPTSNAIALFTEDFTADFTVVGYVDAPESLEPLPAPRLGAIGELEEVLSVSEPNHIVISRNWKSNRLPLRSLLELQWSGLGLETADALYESLLSRVAIRDIRLQELVFSSASEKQSILGEIFTPLAALLVVILAFPLFCSIALLLALSKKNDAEPMVSAEPRLGRQGKVFTRYRFRVPNTGRMQAFLLRLQLNRLPELVNLVRGEMALIGPPPERPEFLPILTKEIPFYQNLLAVKPGLLGWSQLNMRNNKPPLQDVVVKLEYDLYYIKRRTVARDIYIVLHSLLP